MFAFWSVRFFIAVLLRCSIPTSLFLCHRHSNQMVRDPFTFAYLSLSLVRVFLNRCHLYRFLVVDVCISSSRSVFYLDFHHNNYFICVVLCAFAPCSVSTIPVVHCQCFEHFCRCSCTSQVVIHGTFGS